VTFIWATRGRNWGFRFLRDAGLDDPRAEYLRRFAGISHEPRVYRRDGDTVAVRFPDPLRRQDSAGRTIPHEFVVFLPTSADIKSVDDGIRKLWPEVSSTFEALWDRPGGPLPHS
jgi:hypothetical protein